MECKMVGLGLCYFGQKEWDAPSRVSECCHVVVAKPSLSWLWWTRFWQKMHKQGEVWELVKVLWYANGFSWQVIFKGSMLFWHAASGKVLRSNCQSFLFSAAVLYDCWLQMLAGQGKVWRRFLFCCWPLAGFHSLFFLKFFDSSWLKCLMINSYSMKFLLCSP